MAIPFCLPSDDTTLEQYRRIHQLLLDLTALVRAFMARNPEWNRPNNAPNANENVMSPASPALNATPQFVFPLSPPNSQPGSPSPFFTATASAFILPDIVASARTNDIGAQQQPAPAPVPATAAAAAAAATATTAAVATSDSLKISAAVLREKLRKRKRAKMLKRKKLVVECNETNACGGGSGGNGAIFCCGRDQQRKMAKVVVANSTCSCSSMEVDEPTATTSAITDVATTATATATTDNEEQMLRLHAACCAAAAEVPTMHAEGCCLRRQSTSADYTVPMCMNVGEELRRIVDCCFGNPQELEENITSDDIDATKGAGFMSQFGRTVFTAALFLIGWKLLKQN